ncbi:PREDICTED: uncharacterized protein LOC109147039 [Ipomoea nil]|uniref:uncharacterized protein LOC109147039 n=1 Tax=Ipomoea nil TaxID=35883 RepID=UPI0009013B72|nr:PREDICTED: uncharacterized protein LOC109147039 [Ipomoea nil]
MFVLASQISPMNTRQALRLRVVRAYQIPERSDPSKFRSKEIVFHDEETFREIKSNEGLDEKILFDVIGRVIEIHCPQEKLINGKNSRLIDFTIEDTDGIQLMCTLWDEHVSKIEAFYNSTTQEPLLVLIQFCRARVCLKSGDVKICSSYDVTQLLFNQESPPFEEFMKSISQEQTPMRSIISQSSFKECSSYSVSLSADMEVRTINDIYRDKEFGDFWVAARIVFIDDPEWYRIKVRVVDLDGNAPFLLWDRECLDLLGISADDLKDTHTKNSSRIISMHAFPVMRIITDEKIVEKHCPELIGVRDRDLSSKLELELTDEDLWDLEETDQANEAESPLQVVAQRLNAENSVENGTIKRSLIDEFSSTQSSKKSKECVVKIEKEADV